MLALGNLLAVLDLDHAEVGLGEGVEVNLVDEERLDVDALLRNLRGLGLLGGCGRLVGLGVDVAHGRDALHGLERCGEELIELDAQQLGTLGDDVAVAAGGEGLGLELLLERLDLHVGDAAAGAHLGDCLDEPGELVHRVEPLLHGGLGLGQLGVVVGVVRLDHVDELGRVACHRDDVPDLYDAVLEVDEFPFEANRFLVPQPCA